jgi:N-acetyl sugar amidotransferase
MDTTDPLIEFNEEGYCNHCTDYLEKRIKLLNRNASDLQPLMELFNRIRDEGKGSKYDCIVGLSGGVDSSYLALLASRFGLRVLGVHMDNGWNSPIAVDNINNLVEKLGLSYASYVLPWNSFRKVQLAFLKASVPEAETPTDIAIQRAVHHYALKHGVRYILSGGNVASEGILPGSWHYNARDTKYTHSVLKHSNCSRKFFRSQKFGFLDEIYTRFFRRIKTVYPLNYTLYNKEDARVELESKYGWRYYGSKHGESRYTRFIQSYYLFVKHAIDYRRATFSAEICQNSISREVALHLLSELPYEAKEVISDISYISKKLAITTDELTQLIDKPPKWYFDYSNNNIVLGKVYDLYRFLKGKQKTTSF